MLGPTFSVARGRDAGLSVKQLRRADLAAPFRGVRAAASAPTDPRGIRTGRVPTPLELEALALAAAYAERMAPHEFFTGRTAGLILGAPVPGLRDSRPHVGVLAPARLKRVRGVHGHELQPVSTRVIRNTKTGWRITSPATTWASLGASIADPYDLIAVADYFVRVPQMPGGFDGDLGDPIADLAQLRAAVFAGRRVGGPALRAALPRVRTGSSSRPETWMRLVLVDHGLPEPALDHDVFADDGDFIAALDQAYPALRVGIEYEGEHHLTDPRQWARDIARYERLAAAGRIIIRVTKEMLSRHPERFVARVRAALARAARL